MVSSYVLCQLLGVMGGDGGEWVLLVSPPVECHCHNSQVPQSAMDTLLVQLT